MVIALFFLFGLIIGSFLNVCITRIPEGLSIVSPGSRCPQCETPIKAYDNVPVLAWLWLRGKCRACGHPISSMYPAIELLTGFLFVACFLTFGLQPETFKWLFFVSLMVILIVTDFRARILPDAVNFFGFGLGLALSVRLGPIDPACLRIVDRFPILARNPSILGVTCAVLGAAAGSLLLLAAATLYKLVRGREGMGMGDVKMMLMVGTFLGIQGTFLTLLFGTLLGSIVGLLLVVVLFLTGWKSKVAERASRKGLGSVSGLRWTISSRYQLPLGTFLGIAALLVVFFSRWIDMQAYRFMR
ncbi:MAG: prepilin peptidase [Acidobacteria bacterium]|nr:prepilin peptidase [Acidobacteriota bacterium]MBS1865848.1 prepilin peptidase [Acidobacteriota bacterium]